MDDERFEGPPPSDDDNPDDRLPLQWNVLVLEDDGADQVVRVPTSLFDRIRRQTDGTNAYFVRRGLVELAERLEEEAARFVPGSTAPPPVLYRPPTVEKPVPAAEIRQVAEWLRAGTRDAVGSARRAYGEPNVPARRPPRAAPPAEDFSAELDALARRLAG